MKKIIKEFIGAFLVKLQPEKVETLIKKGISFNVKNELSLSERFMRSALLKNAEKNQDFNMLAEYHENFWKETGRKYFSEKENVLKDFFLPNCLPVFEKLHDILKDTHKEFHTMVEIGTGNGDVLDYLSSKFPQIERFVGIDLSVEQINFNQKLYDENIKIEFVAADGFEWIKENGTNNMIIFTSGGVLEYFSEQRLQKFFSYLNELGFSIFIAIEPIGANIDFTKNPNSQPYGVERSFSHDYLRLFKNAGFSLWHESKAPGKIHEDHFGIFGVMNT
ncbi:class I SAM-dependent methyltransferase [Maribacter sp. BPC-D8]|uniref:class I SAM-dependent methyltransferase n=1 Tax=Maribacter sp. BPC-D8 TaxID=3053613 RepID=UPI002B49C008|nr:class I SAM-dependent methyltransferase [Maribacter sp. BPC-D8]WRI28358.1 class I SAM-dependent methyltransferase [Maribacter sp. BPC-D8]